MLRESKTVKSPLKLNMFIHKSKLVAFGAQACVEKLPVEKITALMWVKSYQCCDDHMRLLHKNTLECQ